jgi:hypothetical protein
VSCSPASRRRRVRGAIAELAAHRRRLLAVGVGAEADPTDALLICVKPTQSRTAVTRRARSEGEPQASPLTDVAASQNLSRSAGRAALAPAPDLTEHLGATHPADLHASVDASSIASVGGTAVTLTSHSESGGDQQSGGDATPSGIADAPGLATAGAHGVLRRASSLSASSLSVPHNGIAPTVPLTGHIPHISAAMVSSCAVPGDATTNTELQPIRINNTLSSCEREVHPLQEKR